MSYVSYVVLISLILHVLQFCHVVCKPTPNLVQVINCNLTTVIISPLIIKFNCSYLLITYPQASGTLKIFSRYVQSSRSRDRQFHVSYSRDICHSGSCYVRDSDYHLPCDMLSMFGYHDDYYVSLSRARLAHLTIEVRRRRHIVGARTF